MRIYDIALPAQTALAEWMEFARSDALVRGIGEVHIEPMEGDRSRLSIQGDDAGPLGIDAVVQRFRERLKRRHYV